MERTINYTLLPLHIAYTIIIFACKLFVNRYSASHKIFEYFEQEIRDLKKLLIKKLISVP